MVQPIALIVLIVEEAAFQEAGGSWLASSRRGHLKSYSDGKKISRKLSPLQFWSVGLQRFEYRAGTEGVGHSHVLQTKQTR